jgi:hypothetical protein
MFIQTINNLEKRKKKKRLTDGYRLASVNKCYELNQPIIGLVMKSQGILSGSHLPIVRS